MKCGLKVQQDLQVIVGWENRCLTKQDLAKATARLQYLVSWKGHSSRECQAKLQKLGSSIHCKIPPLLLRRRLFGETSGTEHAGPTALILHQWSCIVCPSECRCRLARLAKENWSLVPAGVMETETSIQLLAVRKEIWH